MRFLYFSALLPIALFSCKQENKVADEDLKLFSGDTVARHVSVLSSDSFMGRKPFTKGEDITINYIKEQYLTMGLEPGNGDSYFQDVPMVNIVTKASDSMQVHSAKGDFMLKGFDDYVIWTDKTDANISLQKDELVFAGYGVVAPEHNWNDYAGLDVKGKVVLVLVNDPGFNKGDASLFKGKTMTYYGRWTYKFEEAARQGAKGCLIIHNTAAASYPFSVVQNNWNGARLHLDDRNSPQKNCDVIGWVSHNAAVKLLTAAGKDSTLLAKADEKGFRPEPLNVQLSTSMQVMATYTASHNVIAKITGSKRPDEYIIYTAHWDHLGTGKPDETGDSIYNGALDNASGSAALLELARVFKNMKTKPERTIIFLHVTAEEQGLWGSAYYATHPVYPAAKTVANINMDGINPFEKRKDIIIIGEGQSELEDYLKEAAKNMDRDVAFETNPEAGYYYRSDHFNFAKVGIPALYIKTGVDVPGKEKGYGQEMEDEYRAKRYHRPSDQFDAATWKFEGGIADLELLFLVGKRLAFETAYPGWKEGSEFRALRK
jgi:Zn-dependent M28 family amino/carboxypeptidase